MVPCSLQSYFCQKWILLAGVSLFIAILVNPSFMVQNPHFRLGQIADRNIKAKHDFLVEDEAATAKKREEAVRQSPLVYDYDHDITKSIAEKLRASFKAMRDAASSAKSESPLLSPNLTVNPAEKTPSIAPGNADRILQEKEDFEKELGCPVGGDVFKCLIQEQFSLDVEEKIRKPHKDNDGPRHCRQQGVGARRPEQGHPYPQVGDRERDPGSAALSLPGHRSKHAN